MSWFVVRLKRIAFTCRNDDEALFFLSRALCREEWERRGRSIDSSLARRGRLQVLADQKGATWDARPQDVEEAAEEEQSK